ncbi:hypothetical protein EDC01DRAFT_638617 [Geopyxis carbonaria]|nr:hypothetical protein EDC01DRAFT_638617 [Geopyxis carbonaria]
MDYQSSSVGHSKNPSIGIKLVYKPPADVQPTVDIVAVHGLGGDVYGTWTAKAASPTGEDVFWLRDLLPAEVPKARILSYGYNSDPVKWMEAASTNNVHQHAHTLVTELHYFRRKKNERYRPIIFVCHSLGGIVVKQALISSNNNSINHNEDLRSIKTSTYGVLFLGTPHMGSDLAHWGKWLESTVRLVTWKSIADSNKALVGALEKNSEILQVITDAFLPIAPDLKLFFFWEELPTKLPNGKMEQIVHYSSAVPESLSNARKAAIHANHSDMCKFADEDSPGWNVLAGVLCDFEADAPVKIEMAWEQEHQRKHLNAQWKVRGTIQGYQRRSPSPGSIDTGFDAGSTAYQRSIEGRQTAMIEAPPPTVVTPHMFKPPTLQENKYFTAREAELARIHTVLLKNRVILIGSATGTGKTHLAREYFFKHRHNFQVGVFWIECKSMKRSPGLKTGTFSTDVLDLQFTAIAEELSLPEMIVEFVEEDEYIDKNEVTRRQVLSWFESHDEWLLVLDGVDVTSNDQIDDISKYVPTNTRGCVIITTVNESLAGAARLGSPELLRLERIPFQDATAMLFHYGHIENPTERDRAAAVELLQELALLPLMIHSAGSYIKSKKIPVAEYLKKYKKRPFVDQGILDVEPFHVIFGQIEEKYHEANNLLRILCFYEQEIPTDMLLWGVKHLPAEIQRSFMAKEDGRYDFNNTIGQLLAHSLIERTPGLEDSDSNSQQSEKIPVDTLRLHSVAQDVCISRMRSQSKDDFKRCLSMALDIFCKSFDTLQGRRKDGEFLVSDYKRYVVHGNHLLEHGQKYKVNTERLEAALVILKELANGDGKISGGRRSMFRSGSMTDSSGLETPTSPSPRVLSWNHPTTHSPGNGDEVSSQTPSQRADTEKWIAAVKRLQTNEKPFEFRYTPPKGPRNPRGRGGRGMPRSSTGIEYGRPPVTTSHVYTEEISRGGYSSPRPSETSVASQYLGSPSVRLRGLLHSARNRLQPAAPEFVPGQFTPRGRSPPIQQHFNPLGRASTPVTGSNFHQQRPPFPGRNRSGSLPPHLQMHHSLAHSAPGGLSMMRDPPYGSSPNLSHHSNQFSPGGSPMVHQAQMMSTSNSQFSNSSHATTSYTPMPPYPPSPGPGIELDPFNNAQPPRPHPFSLGYRPERDVRNSPVARSILGPRDRPPSESCSEPILEDDDFYQPKISTPGGTAMRRDISSGSVPRRSPRSSSGSRPHSRQPSRSPSPYGVFNMETPRRVSLGGSGGSGGHGPHRPVQNSAYPPPQMAENMRQPPPQFVTSPPPPKDSAGHPSPGLGIEGVVYAFQSSPPSQPVELAATPAPQHTRHASLGDGPLGKSNATLGIPKSPLRRSSVPESPAGAAEMLRSHSEPQTQTAAHKPDRSPPMPGSWDDQDIDELHGGVYLRKK